MKQRIQILIIISLFLFIGIASADTHTVSGSSRSDILSTFNEAASGDTVTFPEGDYYLTDSVIITGKDLKIIGEGTVKIHSTAGADPCLIFSGSAVLKTTSSKSVSKGSTTIEIPDGSKVKAGDLIKIWKNVKWCPKDYPEQLTGEVYKITSIDGNTITLNEPLLRDYPSGANIEITRPVKITVDNLQILNTDPKGKVEGLRLQYCTDSTIKNCIFRDNGRAAIRIKCCWNTVIENNKIFDSTRPGNGYGVSIYDGSAYITVKNNYIKNCRHCISSGASLEFNSLNRELLYTYNTVIGGKVTDSFTLDAHEMAISNTVTHNEIYVQDGWAAYQDGSLNSVYTDNTIYVEENRPKTYSGGTYRKRGHVDGGTHVRRDNEIRIWKETPRDNIDYEDDYKEDEEDEDIIPPEDNTTEDNTTDDDSVVIDDEEIYEENFDSVFDVLDLEFSDSAYIEQGVLDPNIEWKSKGKYTEAWIDVPGYTGQLHIGNTTYIPKSPDECAIVLYGTENTAERPKGQTATKKVYMDEGKLTVELTVKTKYEVLAYKTYIILGKKVRIPYYKGKSETVTFTKSFDTPEIFPAFQPPKVYVTNYNGSHVIVYTPKLDGIVRVDSSYNSSKCTERRLIGYIGTAENGFRSTDFEKIDSWAFSGLQMSRSPHGVYIKETDFHLDKLNVTVVTPYDSFEITDFEYKIIEDDSRKIVNYALFAFVICMWIYGRAIYKIIMMLAGRYF